MSAPQDSNAPVSAPDSTLIRVAIWVAIGALIAAAIVCVVWVLIGSQNGIIGRAFLTILLLAAFAGVAILDARLAAHRPAWFALTSMIVWVVTLLIGAFLVWMPERGYGYGYGRFMSFLVIVLILQLAVLHVRLFFKAYQRYVTPFTTVVTIVTVALVGVLAFMLVFPLAFNEYFTFTDAYWRWVVAFAILAAVGTALIPLINTLFAPKKARPLAPEPYGYAQPAPQGWPTYFDGVTPLPVLPDGSPDWTAYYTGYPSNTAQAIAPVAPQAIPAQPAAWPVPGGEPDGYAQTSQPWAGPASQQEPWAASTQDASAGLIAPPPSWADPAAPHDPEGAAPGGYVAPGYQGYPPPPPLPPRQ